MIQALVFDFDGLMLDTEGPLVKSWRVIYERCGVEPLTIDEWAGSLGLDNQDPAKLDPLGRLETAIGRPVPDDLQDGRRRIRDEIVDGESMRPGVEALLDQADRLGVQVGIASSSPISWIERHLGPRGMLDRFAAISCAGDGVRGKPDPATYSLACQALNADPARSVALEDSPNGVRAAKAAGMTCIAVPNGVSRDLDVSHADLVVSTLLDVDLSRIWGG
ncbi:MAG: HAD family hydrolase [Acidimicrobiales bacterium]